MKRIYKFSISILFILCSLLSYSQQADTVKAQKTLGLGFDLAGPAMYFIDTTKYSFEAHLAYRLNYKYFIVVEPGYSGFNTSNYNYEYNCSGVFIRVGADISLLEPEALKINHFAGIGLRYGIAVFNQETPMLITENYWGEFNTPVEKNNINAHFFELQGGVKAELFKNFLMGWSVKLRTMIYSSGKQGQRPIYIPGMGKTDRFITANISYYLIYRIPFSSASGE